MTIGDLQVVSVSSGLLRCDICGKMASLVINGQALCPSDAGVLLAAEPATQAVLVAELLGVRNPE